MKPETLELPNWYAFRKIKGHMTVAELIELGKKKIDLLFELTKDKEALAYKEPDPKIEVIGGLALRIVAALTEDRFFKSWLIENEGDLLSVRFHNAKYDEKIAILKDLFGDIILGWRNITYFFDTTKDEIWQELYYLIKDYVKTSKDFSKIFSSVYNTENGVIAVKFWTAPRLLKRKRAILRQGWLITATEFLMREIKWKFQRRLEESIKRLIEEKKRGSEKILSLEDPMKELIDYWRSRRDVVAPKTEFSFKGSKLYERPDLWPLCMRILLSRLESTGYLAHGERLQLGLFLKRLGMSLDEQLQFWYKFAVDNVGMSWEEFEKKGGYYIKHIYGVVGSKKDYEAPKCETIIAKYFCPFKALSSTQIKDIILSLHQNVNEKVLQKILEKTRLGEPTVACALYLSIVAKRRFRIEKISHPLQFIRLAYLAEKRKRAGKNENTSNAK